MSEIVSCLADKFFKNAFSLFVSDDGNAYQNHCVTFIKTYFDLSSKSLTRRLYSLAYWNQGLDVIQNKMDAKLLKHFGDLEALEAAIKELKDLKLNATVNIVRKDKFGIWERTEKRKAMLKKMMTMKSKREQTSVEDAKYKKSRLFRLSPMMKMKRQFIRLDNRSCYQLKALAKQLQVPWSEVPEKQMLSSLFKRSSKIGFSYGASLETNNVQMSVLYAKEKHERTVASQKNNKRKRDEEKMVLKDYSVPADVTWENLRCIDPGNVNFVAYGNAIDKERSWYDLKKVSLKQWKDRSRRNWLKIKMKRRKKKSDVGKLAAKVENKLQVIGRRGVYSYADFVQEALIRREGESILWNCYGARTIADWKFYADSKARQALDKIADELSDYGRFHIGFGDCGRTTGIKGCDPSGPVKKLYRHLRKKTYVGKTFKTFLVAEGMTSKMSSCCHVETKALRIHKFFVKLDKTLCVASRGVKICRCCNTYWDRDFNPVINMCNIVHSLHLNGNRPSYLCHNSQ